jgi:signal transduction histidine kinase
VTEGEAGLRIAAEESARRRIARQLHDDFGQRLAALTFEVKAVGKQIAGGDPRRTALDALEAIASGLMELAEDLRRLSHDLHPAALERRGLTAALGDHCREVERRSGLEVRLHLDGGDGSVPPGPHIPPLAPLPPDIALGLYRIAQEALANAVRHSGARAIEVALARAAGSVHLTVADDGDGFDREEARSGGGLGLTILDERARLLGGELRIATGHGAGTVIEVTVPSPAP